MKVLMLNGSPRKNGNTSIALAEMERVFTAAGVETEILQVGGLDIRGCTACGACMKTGRKNGNTSIALAEMERVFTAAGVETEILQVGGLDIRGCTACGACMKTGRCVFDDLVNQAAPKFEACDGLVAASPVYYASANATLAAFLTRLFYSTHFDKTMKVGASVVCARRGGLSAAFDELNKFFTISGMPVASSQYWNSIHGREPGQAGASVVCARRGGLSAAFDELNKFFTISGMPVASSQYWNSIHGREPGQAAQDEEGLQTMRTLARNMTFLMKSIALGREAYGLPEKESPARTNFIR